MQFLRLMGNPQDTFKGIAINPLLVRYVTPREEGQGAILHYSNTETFTLVDHPFDTVVGVLEACINAQKPAFIPENVDTTLPTGPGNPAQNAG